LLRFLDGALVRPSTEESPLDAYLLRSECYGYTVKIVCAEN
jgi:hypothetical protein